MQFIKANMPALLLLLISVFIHVNIVTSLVAYGKKGMFLPSADLVLTQARETKDPNLCSLILEQSQCFSELAKVESLHCDALSESDLQTLCMVMTGTQQARNSCEHIQRLGIREECIVELASRLKDVVICNDLTKPTDPEGKILTREDTVRRVCLHRIGRETRSTNPCNLVESAYRQSCLDEVQGKAVGTMAVSPIW